MSKFLPAAAAAIVFLLFCTQALAQSRSESIEADRKQERSIASKEGLLDQKELGALSAISYRLQLDDETLDRVTGKMAAGLTTYETRPVVEIFESYQKHAALPTRTFEFLLDYMLSLSELSYVAADALKTLPVDDTRRSRAIVALNTRLQGAADDRETLYSIAYLERFQRYGPLIGSSVAELVVVAETRSDLTLRKRALDLARTQQLNEIHKRAIFDLVMQEIDQDDDLLSAESIRVRNRNMELPYILQVLVETSPQPYPPALIDLLVAHFPRFTTLGLPVFAEFRKTQSFSAGQQEMMRRWASSESAISATNLESRLNIRSTLIQMLWPPAGEESIAAAAFTLATARDFSSRCLALYNVRQFYTDTPLPGSVANSLQDALIEDRFPELRFVGAGLLLGADVEFDVRERWILDLLSQEVYRDQLDSLLLDAYDKTKLQHFIAQHATNQQLPAMFRQLAIQRLESMASPGDSLPTAAEDALVQVALTDQDMYPGIAESALVAWGVEPPVSDRMREASRRAMAGNIADGLFLFLSIVAIVAFIYGLFAIPMARSKIGLGAPGSVGAVVGWIALAVVTLASWGYGLIFSFGIHGSGAPGNEHFGLMMPFYFMSTIMLAIAIAVSRMNTGRTVSAKGTPVPKNLPQH